MRSPTAVPTGPLQTGVGSTCKPCTGPHKCRLNGQLLPHEAAKSSHDGEQIDKHTLEAARWRSGPTERLEDRTARRQYYVNHPAQHSFVVHTNPMPCIPLPENACQAASNLDRCCKRNTRMRTQKSAALQRGVVTMNWALTARTMPKSGTSREVLDFCTCPSAYLRV
jgi:hypothetical protein